MSSFSAFPDSSAKPHHTVAASSHATFSRRDLRATATSIPRTTPARAQAIAVRDGRIVAVGTNDDIRKLKGNTHPGSRPRRTFRDARIQRRALHLASGGFEKLNVDLVGVKSLAEMQQRIAARAKTTPAGDWIVGEGWDHTLWPGQKLPTRQDLDAVTGSHPAVFGRVDGHISVANSAALQKAGIGQTTPRSSRWKD